ncbi:hypothetical protein HDA44_004999 [Kribbella solani]|uniref:Uncharacterized protein n=1 Tax=Kribbella solani TaxID=236067 RepID=A0A841E2Q3_9ACTN|nr:hypothetical protein [Kribbella solani]
MLTALVILFIVGIVLDGILLVLLERGRFL